MNAQIAETTAQEAQKPAFPLVRPAIVITRLDEPPFAVDCAELRSWSIVPRLGERASWASYDPPGWNISEVAEMRVLRPSTVHDIPGVEIEVRNWKPETGWGPDGTMHGRLTDEKAQFLAINLTNDAGTQIETILDQGFDWNWGEMERRLEDRGTVRYGPDGSLRFGDRAAVARGTGAGLFSVTVGEKRFTCLRVLECQVSDIPTALDVAYLTREGRTVLNRRYCPPRFVEAATRKIVLDETEQYILEGETFTHWYDTLTHLVLSNRS